MKLNFIRICFITVLLLLNVNLNFYSADDDNLTQIIVVGYYSGSGIIDDESSTNNIGFSYEILTQIEFDTNYEFEYQKFNNKEEMLTALNNNEIDVAGLISDEDVNPNIMLLDSPFTTKQIVLASKESDIYYDDLSSINNSTISIYEGDNNIEELNQYLSTNNIKANLIYHDYNNYLKEDADFYLVSSLNNHTINHYTAKNLKIEDYFLAVNINNTNLFNNLNNAYNRLLVEEQNLLVGIDTKYYGSSNLSNIGLTKSQASSLKHKVFNVCFTEDHQPLEYLNYEGDPDGIAVEILNGIATEYDFNLDYIPYSPFIDFDKNSRPDIILGNTTKSNMNLDNYTIIPSYYELSMSIIAHNSADLDNINTIGMLRYVNINAEKISMDYSNAEIKYYDNFVDLFNAFLDGDVEICFITSAGIEYAEYLLGYYQDYLLISTSYELPLAIYINNEIKDEYYDVFSTMYNQLSDGYITQVIVTETKDYEPTISLGNIIEDNIFFILIALFIAVVSISTYILWIQDKSKKELKNALDIDAVTNLASMHNFMETVSQKLPMAGYGEYEIITLDIDHFKLINNTYGYETGTETIRIIAKKLSETLKGTSAIISRVEEEKHIIYRKRNDGGRIEDICEYILIPSIKRILSDNYNLSMSVGIYQVFDNKLGIDILIDRANFARKVGKSFHRVTYNTFDEKMQRKFEKNNDIVLKMYESLKNKEFKIVLQPKVDLSTYKIVGAEILVRWIRDDGFQYFPDEFIPSFEENGFIYNLDLYIFEETCRYIDKYRKKYILPKLSVNFSGLTLQDVNLETKLLEILDRYDLPTSVIEIEVTESSLVSKEEVLKDILGVLQGRGFTISMDDFGSGESSLNRLGKINVDIIKIDKGFLQENILVESGRVVIRNIISMIKELDVKIVCEGIENIEEAELLKTYGCDIAQGYLFDRPLSTLDFLTRLDDHDYKEVINNKE